MCHAETSQLGVNAADNYSITSSIIPKILELQVKIFLSLVQAGETN